MTERVEVEARNLNEGGHEMRLKIPRLIWEEIMEYAFLPNDVTGIGCIRQESAENLLVERIFSPINRSANFAEDDKLLREQAFSKLCEESLMDVRIIPGPSLRRLTERRLYFYWRVWQNERSLSHIGIEEGANRWEVNLLVNSRTYSARFDMLSPFHIKNYPLEVLIESEYSPLPEGKIAVMNYDAGTYAWHDLEPHKTGRA